MTIEDIVRRLDAIAAKERLMTDNVLAGMAVTEVMGMDYETLLQNRGDSS